MKCTCVRSGISCTPKTRITKSIKQAFTDILKGETYKRLSQQKDFTKQNEQPNSLETKVEFEI